MAQFAFFYYFLNNVLLQHSHLFFLAALRWDRDLMYNPQNLLFFFVVPQRRRLLTPSCSTYLVTQAFWIQNEKIGSLPKDLCFWTYGNVQEKPFLGIISNNHDNGT